MRALVIPLDIRPYNYSFLKDLSQMVNNLDVVLPPPSILGVKKTAANFAELDSFLWDNIADSDVLILSLDMFLYGGLLPSRIHEGELPFYAERLAIISKIGNQYPHIKIYASNLIMRTPQYNSSDEEPDYYETYGQSIFRYGYLVDKARRLGLDLIEQEDLFLLQQQLPQSIITNYEQRRTTNCGVTLLILGLLKARVIELLIIPQDDATPFGYPALDQRKIYQKMGELRLFDNIFLHPGTDEAGCTLLTRAYMDYFNHQLVIFPFFSSETAKQLVPNFEDRPLGESLRSHSAAMAVTLGQSSTESEMILAINSPSLKMDDTNSFGLSSEGELEQSEKDVSYYSYRNLSLFVAGVSNYLDNGYEVGLADLAFSNGGERELIERCDDAGILDQMAGYAAWNTSCNSLGTIIATMVFSHYGKHMPAIKVFLIKRLLNDWVYQGELKKFLVEVKAKEQGLTSFDADHDLVVEMLRSEVMKVWNKRLQKSFLATPFVIKNIEAPFRRFSGLDFIVELC